MPRTSIVGHHRSGKLAERHRRDLERKHGVPVEITARQNAAGEESARGHTFIFEWEDEYVDIIGIDSVYE